MASVVKSVINTVKEKGIGGFLKHLKNEGYLRCLPDGNLLQTNIHNIGARLVGVDKFGNKYYEKLENTQYGMDFKGAVKDTIPWDGTLSSSDFSLTACTFSDKWKRFNPSFPPWHWIPRPKHQLLSSDKEGYLSLENVCLVKSSEGEDSNRSLTWKEESSISQGEEPFDHATLVCPEYEVNHYDFHIVYSPSYRVPVLYFRSYHSDGQPLSFSEIEKDLPDHSSKLLSESKWTFITQEEHPYLNRPWFKLHPCGTSEWVKLLFHGDASLNKNIMEQYLVSWFSVIGQVVGLKIPLEMLDTFK